MKEAERVTSLVRDPGNARGVAGLVTRERPSPVAVYLQAKPAMEANLRVVLRLLDPESRVSVRDFPWQDLRYENVSGIRTRLVDHLAPSYARKCLVAVRGVLKVAWRMGLLDRDTMERAIDVDPIKGDAEQAGRMLTPGEIRRILAIAGARDRAIVVLAAYAGLRREEISALDEESIQPNGAVRILGKGRKLREVFLPLSTIPFLAAWRMVRGNEPGPLFFRGRRGGKIVPGRRLSPSGVWEVIARVAKAAGVENVTPHDFRRTFASTLFDAGVDPVTVQKLMGHEDPKTTVRYDRRGNERKIQAAEALAKALSEEDPG
jgi:integrase